MSLLNLFVAVVTAVFVHSDATSASFASSRSYSAPATTWTGKTGDLTVIMSFEQGADSVFARGSYEVAPGKRVGCGGETLAPKGLFTMRAKGTTRSFRGRFLFDAGWSPPVNGTRSSSESLKISIHSVDRGVCPLILRPTKLHNPAIRH